MEVSKCRKRFITVLCLLASLMLICGFSAQFSSDPMSGLILIMIAFFIITIIDIHDIIVARAVKYDLYPLLKTKVDRHLEIAASVCHIIGSFFCLIATLTVTDGRVSLVWSGLIGSIMIFIGSLLNVWRGFRNPRTELTAAQKMQESLI